MLEQLPPRDVRSLLEDAVRSHLIADVPVGVFLSSGIDSTAIATLAAKAQSGIHTFTVSFPDTEFSEGAIARRTAERIGSQHCEAMISGEEMVGRLPEAVAALDQPSMDGVNTYFVSWAARQAGLKVALSGLGSDELFGGYTSFRATTKVERVAGAARFVSGTISQVDRFGNKADSPFFKASPDAFRKGLGRLASAEVFSSSLLFHASAFCAEGFCLRIFNGGTIGLESMPWYQWLEDAVEPVAVDGSVHTSILAGVALVHGEHAVAGYGRDEHAQFARSARSISGYSARGIRSGACRSRSSGAMDVRKLCSLRPWRICCRKK